jgi:hypothetical protein
MYTCYIYRTSDNLYLIYSEGACQYLNESARTRFELTRPFTVNQSDTKCHVFCKWFVEWSNGMSPHVRNLAHGIESLLRDNKLHPHVYCKLYLRYSIPDFKGKHTNHPTSNFFFCFRKCDVNQLILWCTTGFRTFFLQFCFMQNISLDSQNSPHLCKYGIVSIEAKGIYIHMNIWFKYSYPPYSIFKENPPHIKHK